MPDSERQPREQEKKKKRSGGKTEKTSSESDDGKNAYDADDGINKKEGKGRVPRASVVPQHILATRDGEESDQSPIRISLSARGQMSHVVIRTPTKKREGKGKADAESMRKDRIAACESAVDKLLVFQGNIPVTLLQ